MADLGMGGVALQDAAAIVGGAVIQQDELEVLKVLREDALESLLEVARIVVVRYDDRDEGGVHSWAYLGG